MIPTNESPSQSSLANYNWPTALVAIAGLLLQGYIIYAQSKSQTAIEIANKSAVITQAKVDQATKKTDDVHAMLRSIERTVSAQRIPVKPEPVSDPNPEQPQITKQGSSK